MALYKFIEPPYRHHPGVNARPSGGVLAEIAEAASAARHLQDVAIDRAWHYGLFLMRRRFFWEAHEVLEPVWMVAPPNSRERHLVRGLIQLANACLKADMGRSSAALRLLDMAGEHLTDASYGDDGLVLGIDVAQCVAAVRDVRQAIQHGQDWLVDIGMSND